MGDEFLPDVVDDTGAKVVGPELEAITNLTVKFAQLAQLAKIRKAVEQQNFQGIEDPRNAIAVTDEEQWIDLRSAPKYPWISMFVYNDGPKTVYIAINDPTLPIRVVPKSTRTFDHANSPKKIEMVYYYCNPGETATLDIIGQY